MTHIEWGTSILASANDVHIMRENLDTSQRVTYISLLVQKILA
jgi:hypothetical protein